MIDRLRRYSWPGNVRELQNVIERAVITSQDGRLEFEHLVLPHTGGSVRPQRPVPRPRVAGHAPLTRDDLARFEAENLSAALAQTGGKLYGPGGAAEPARHAADDSCVAP